MLRAIRSIGLTFAGLLFTVVPVAAQSFHIVKVADGVYAAIGIGEAGSNGAFIVNQDDVVVVDTQRRPAWTREIISEIKKVTKNPVRYVINTHYHLDHWLGNEAYVDAYGPGVEFIAQQNTREDAMGKGIQGAKDNIAKDIPDQIAKLDKMLAAGKDDKGNALTSDSRKELQEQLESQKATLDVLKKSRYTVPNLTFDKRMILNGGGREIDLLYFGRGHTRGDLVVFLPKEKVMMSGDLLNGRIPVMRDAHLPEWIDVLGAMTKLDYNTTIPGHGDVEQGMGHILEFIAYLKDDLTQAKNAVAKGMTAEQFAKSADLNKYAKEFSLNFESNNAAAIQRAYDEAAGKIKD